MNGYYVPERICFEASATLAIIDLYYLCKEIKAMLGIFSRKRARSAKKSNTK